LFSGVGGFRAALDELGGRCVFASEIDKYAAQSYKAIYGDSGELHGDITKIDAKVIPDHDVLVGGFPCQAFSVAGQRKGFEDTRGTLFFEIARIAAEKKPRLLLLENVKGLLSHDGGNTFKVMCRTLNEIGYAIDFRVLNSKYFGVPQNRERIFIVADRDAVHEPWADIKGNDVVTKAKRNAIAFGVRSFNFDWPTEGDVTVRLRDVLEPLVDEKYYLSEEKTAKLIAQLDASEPQVLRPVRTDYGKEIRKQYEAGSIQESRHNMTELKPRTDGISNTITTVEKDNLLAEPVVRSIGNTNPSGNGMNGNVYDSNGLSPTLTTNKGEGLKVTEEVRPVLTPDREEKRQNGRRFKENEEEAFTLTAQDKHGVAIGMYPRYRIRKLTPLECWRLQGFPDAAHETAKLAGVSDSQRYKQAGNAVTVNVISVIGKQLVTLLDKPSSLITRLSESVRSEAVVAVG
jgi:DNA (cytosine-5)-methyltransferase 1